MQIYLISPPKETTNFSAVIFDKITDIIPVKYFQFRPKFQSLKDRESFVEKYHFSFLEICKKKKIKLIINDDFEIAEKFYFDGIHLGQDDKSCLAAKKKFGVNFIVGVTCSNSINLYKNAKEEGANYVAFGPSFKTNTKNKKAINLNSIKSFTSQINLPFVLIGGINHKNIKLLFNLKPNYVAIIESLWNFKYGPIESANQFKEILKGKNYENDS